LVAKPKDGCPKCKEERIDELVWAKDGTEVTCQSCGTKYKPDGKQ
jgi:ribosomal protein S27E